MDNDETWWKNLGDNFLKMGAYDESLQCYENATRINPEYISALNNMGYSLSKLGRKEEARKIKIKIGELKEKQNLQNQPSEQKKVITIRMVVKILIVSILGALLLVTFLFIYTNGGFQFLINAFSSFSIGLYTVVFAGILLGISIFIVLLKPFTRNINIGLIGISILGIIIISFIIGLLLFPPMSSVFTFVDSDVISERVLPGIPPEGISVSVQIGKDPVYHTIVVIFTGGNGQSVTNYCIVKVTRSDGRIITEQLKPEKLAEVQVPGTSDPDRVEVFVVYLSGQVYKIYDNYLPNKKL